MGLIFFCPILFQHFIDFVQLVDKFNLHSTKESNNTGSHYGTKI